MTKSIIVEDDPSHSTRLLNLLKKLDAPIEVMAIASTVDEAVAAIGEYHPELVFLDIELDEGKTGFDLLKTIINPDFGVIFTTAHVDNNIQEIRICGISYIVKPYIQDELKTALDKYLTHSSSELEGKKLSSLKVNMDVENISEKTTWISDNNTFLQIHLDKILYCESDNQYTHFHILADGKSITKHTSSYGLGIWEKDLMKYKFCRISRSHLVNILHVNRFQKNEGHVVLTNEIHLSVSQAGKEALLKIMKR